MSRARWTNSKRDTGRWDTAQPQGLGPLQMNATTARAQPPDGGFCSAITQELRKRKGLPSKRHASLCFIGGQRRNRITDTRIFRSNLRWNHIFNQALAAHAKFQEQQCTASTEPRDGKEKLRNGCGRHRESSQATLTRRLHVAKRRASSTAGFGWCGDDW